MSDPTIRLSGILSLHRKYWVILLALTISLEVSANQLFSREVQLFDSLTQGGLVLTQNSGERMYVVEYGQIIKVWVGKQAEKGTFLELRNDSLSINRNGTIKTYAVPKITKIKVFGNTGRVVLGAGLKIWGGAIIGAGIIAPFTLGPGGLIFSVPGWAVGYGIYKIGAFIAGDRKFNLEKNWRINSPLLIP